MKKTLIVPKFATEADEAQWWDDHMDVVEENLIQAIEDGTATRLTREKLEERIQAAKAKALSVRMSEGDLMLARKLAEKKGVPYQAYVQSLLHEALERESTGGK